MHSFVVNVDINVWTEGCFTQSYSLSPFWGIHENDNCLSLNIADLILRLVYTAVVVVEIITFGLELNRRAVASFIGSK